MKTFNTFLFLSIALFLVSCESSDVESHTEKGVKGRPSSFIFTDNNTKDTYSYDTENRLSKITYGLGGVSMAIQYTNNEPLSCSFTHNPSISGISKIEYNRIDSKKIMVSFVFPEDASGLKNQLLVLNDDGLPLKLYILNGDTPDESDGICSYEISYYPNSTRIKEKTKYIDGNTIVYKYEYDDIRGTTSNVNLPVWFRVFIVDFSVKSTTDYGLLNDVNNITTIEVYKNNVLNTSQVYEYSYDSEGYPISLLEPLYKQRITINY